MKKNIRIIARLDIKGPNVVKGIHLEGLRVVGRPELFASAYYKQGVDELIYIDSVASLYGRNNLQEIVSRAAKEIHIPLTVGGGIRSVEDVRQLLRAGAEKVAINTEIIKRPELIKEIAKVFGAQCIVASIQAKFRGEGKYECLTDNARECSGIDVFEWAKKVADFGIGEILVTSVDRDGTGKGYDLELVGKLADMVSIPVIAHGGAGDKEHIEDVIKKGKADAVCAASIFHYGLTGYMADKHDYSEEGNIDFLKQRLPLHNFKLKSINPISVSDLKNYLIEKGVYCRKTQDVFVNK